MFREKRERKKMVEIADNYLIVFLAAVFIPSFIYLIKMLMVVSDLKGKYDSMKIEIDIRIKEVCKDLERLQKDVENIFNRFTYKRGSDKE